MVAFQQRLIGAAVVIGDSRFQMAALVADGVKFDSDAGARPAVGGIENMRA